LSRRAARATAVAAARAAHAGPVRHVPNRPRVREGQLSALGARLV
jgi:hypothetical protein